MREAELIIPIRSEVAGFFKIESWVPDAYGREIKGSRRLLADWFPNVILDSGMEKLFADVAGTGAPFRWAQAYAQVGKNNTFPDPAQVQLIEHVAGVAEKTFIPGYSTASPYYGWARLTYQFLPGFAGAQGAGALGINLSEIGVGSAPVGALFSRALILDGNGNATSITVYSNEYLEVSYECRQYPPLVDWTNGGEPFAIPGSVGIGGNTNLHNVIVRASRAGTTTVWSNTYFGFNGPSGIGCANYTGNIGPVTGTPAGATQGATNSPSKSGYTAGTLSRTVTSTFTPNDGNVPIRCSMIGLYRGEYQCQFDPPIPKTDKHQFVLTWRISSARRDPL